MWCRIIRRSAGLAVLLGLLCPQLVWSQAEAGAEAVQSSAPSNSRNSASLASGNALLQQGIRAFRKQKFVRAREFFLQAQAAGLGSPKLHYNLGVVHYKLAQPQAAVGYFKLAAQDAATEQIAYYNLARCAQALGDSQQASDWYVKAMQGRDPRIADLARRANGEAQAAALKEWQLTAQVGLGFDTEVVGLVDQVTSLPTNTADVFEEIQALAAYHGLRPYQGDLSLQLSAYHLAYQTVQKADVQSFAGGMRWRRDVAQNQRLAIGLNLGHEWLDHQPYQFRSGLVASWEHAWGRSWLKYELNAEWLNSQLAESGPIEGLRAELSTSLVRRVYSGLGLFSVFGQYNHRKSEENSPTRYGASLQWRSPQWGAWSATPGLQWRSSRYDHASLPPEQRLRMQVRLLAPLSPGWQSRVDLQYEHNRSDDESRRYEHLRVLLGLLWASAGS